MRLSELTLLALVALTAASPINTFRFSTEDFSNEQSLEVLSNAVTGHYTFMTPEGIKYFVRYIADHRGFRILDSNALPQRRPSAAGVLQQRSRQAQGNGRVQQRSGQAFGTSGKRFDSIESDELHQRSRQAQGNGRVQQRSRQAHGNGRVQQRSRQAFGTSGRQFNSKESNEFFDSDERFF